MGRTDASRHAPKEIDAYLAALPEDVRATRTLALDVGGEVVRIELPDRPCQRLFVRLDRHRKAAVLVAVYPDTRISPGDGHSLRVVLERMS